MRPVVSVALITYNHEAYIEQAIESAVSQELMVPFEVIVGEDCSTDNTRSLVERFQRNYPDLIVPIFRQKRVGSNGNMLDVFASAQGDYIAYLDGDDYWTDPRKLQKQLDLFTANPSYVICHHEARLQYEQLPVERSLYTGPLPSPVTGVDDLLPGCYIAPSTYMFPKRALQTPCWVGDLLCADWALHILLAMSGPIYYINEPMSVYRVHATGMWSRLGVPDRLLGYLELYQALLKWTPLRSNKRLWVLWVRTGLHTVRQLIRARRYAEARRLLLRLPLPTR